MTNTTTANRTVVGLFDDFDSAQRAVTALENAGVPREHTSIVAGNESGKYSDHASGSGEVGKGIAGGAGAGAAVGGGLGLVAGLMALAIPGFGPVIAAGPIAAALTGAGIGAAAGGLIGGLTKAGVSEGDAEFYAEGVKRGGVLVTVKTSEDLADTAADVLDDSGAVDIDERSGTWRSSGWNPTSYQESSYRDSAYADTSYPNSENIDAAGDDRKLEVIQEELEVGKRRASGRTVRVYSDISAQAVEQQVDLRNETIHVDRKRVDRPANPGEIGAFEEAEIELTEVREEPVVSKRARVVEEVRVGKDTELRTETVRDSVRRQDVRVEEGKGDNRYADEYRTDFQSRYASSGRTYDHYAPAYEFGSKYANEQRYRDADWTTAEADMRRDWEKSGSGNKWEDMKDAVRYGWDRMRGRR